MVVVTAPTWTESLADTGRLKLVAWKIKPASLSSPSSPRAASPTATDSSCNDENHNQHDRVRRPPLPSLSRQGQDFVKIRINGVSQLALLDDQAYGNFMSVDLAYAAGCTVVPALAQFMLGNGAILQSREYTQAVCMIGPSMDMSWVCGFHLLSNLTHPVVLGRPFLEKATYFKPPYFHQTFCTHGPILLSTPHLKHNVCLKITLNGASRTREVAATLDGAATTSLLTLSLARLLGLRIDQRWQAGLRLGSGSTMRVVGTARASFTILTDPSTLAVFRTTFVVVAHLPFSCILGNSAIKLLQSFAQLRKPYPWTCVPEDRSLFCDTTKRKDESFGSLLGKVVLKGLGRDKKKPQNELEPKESVQGTQNAKQAPAAYILKKEKARRQD